jgi:hypothetical protein
MKDLVLPLCGLVDASRDANDMIFIIFSDAISQKWRWVAWALRLLNCVPHSQVSDIYG